ncbi:MAG TPA: L,D-transpeptidase family protein [Solirubrobacteraceae bacterium]|nr:L,D-transpeptidase family protein [Solirubrobacteraceae bacterium]
MRLATAAAGLSCAVVAACGAAAPAAAAQAAGDDERIVRPANLRGPLGDERLSDERRLSRYAGALSRAIVRLHPSPSARRVGRLRYLTEDGPYEVYPVLESHVDAAGRTWLHIRLPQRPNGRTGWVPRGDLGKLKAVRTMLRVNRATRRATLYRAGRRVWSSPIGVGTRSTPTPRGTFWIRSRLRGLAGRPAYGPYAFGTGAYSTLSDWPGGGVIGIHGTNQPALIPGAPSHGCIRVPNAAITRLWPLLPIGTPVVIL